MIGTKSFIDIMTDYKIPYFELKDLSNRNKRCYWTHGIASHLFCSVVVDVHIVYLDESTNAVAPLFIIQDISDDHIFKACGVNYLELFLKDNDKDSFHNLEKLLKGQTLKFNKIDCYKDGEPVFNLNKYVEITIRK